MEKYTFTIGDFCFEYTITFSSKRKSVAIGVYRSDRRVEIKAPKGYSIDRIHQLVGSKAQWIKKNLQTIDLRNELQPALEYTNGSKHLFLGNIYTLDIKLGHRASVDMIGDTIYLKALRAESIEKILKLWYFHKAHELIPAIIAEDIVDFTNKYKKSPTKLGFAMVKSYWGICSCGMEIKLNAELIRAKEEHIHFIIKHELCHLIHRNHSSRFYKLLEEICPNWKSLKKELNDLVRLR